MKAAFLLFAGWPDRIPTLRLAVAMVEGSGFVLSVQRRGVMNPGGFL